MQKLSSLAMTLIGLILVGLGVFILVRGGDTLLGLLCIVFFGTATLAGVLDFLPKRPPLVDPEGSVKINASQLRASVFAFGGGVFLFAGVAILVGAGQTPNWFVIAAAVAAIPFGLAALVYAGRKALGGGPLYTIDRNGVEAHSGLKWHLRWVDIAGMSAQRISSNAWLELNTFPEVEDPPGWAGSLNRRFGRPPYALMVGMSNVDFDAMCALVYEYWTAAQNGPLDT